YWAGIPFSKVTCKLPRTPGRNWRMTSAFVSRTASTTSLPAESLTATEIVAWSGQAVGITEVHDDIWLVSFMDYDLGYFNLETRVLEPLENPFGPKVLPMS